MLTTAAWAQRTDDSFLAGYALAVLEREFQMSSPQVVAKGGVLTVRGAGLRQTDPARVRQVLELIPGVVRVELDDSDTGDPGVGASPAVAAALPSWGDPRSFLSRGPLLFEPVHADPRWPHFSVAWHEHRDSDSLSTVAAASFGESLPLIRRRTVAAGEWDLGLQAGVFSIFDLDTDSFDLVNADYFVGPIASWRHGRFSALARIYHQSSHLGDEYLLRARPERINVSYEVVDLLASFDVFEPLRIYGGGGYVLHSDTALEHWLVQGGAELFGDPIGTSGIRPLVACDVQMREQHNWDVDVSGRLGIELADPKARGGRMQIAIEYYLGASPNGQFFEQNIEFLGVGMHFFF
jgi:hypothetical protein